jgi:hypothetical protein
LEQRHRDRWTACTVYRQSKVLMSYLQPSRASELLAMNRSRLRAAVGLLTGHTSLRAHLYKLGHTERGYAVAQLVEALRYKPEGRGFDS